MLGQQTNFPCVLYERRGRITIYYTYSLKTCQTRQIQPNSLTTSDSRRQSRPAWGALCYINGLQAGSSRGGNSSTPSAVMLRTPAIDNQSVTSEVGFPCSRSTEGPEYEAVSLDAAYVYIQCFFGVCWKVYRQVCMPPLYPFSGILPI